METRDSFMVRSLCKLGLKKYAEIVRAARYKSRSPQRQIFGWKRRAGLRSRPAWCFVKVFPAASGAILLSLAGRAGVRLQCIVDHRKISGDEKGVQLQPETFRGWKW